MMRELLYTPHDLAVYLHRSTRTAFAVVDTLMQPVQEFYIKLSHCIAAGEGW